MKTHETLIIRHFLKNLEQSHRDSELLQSPISASFLHLLKRQELVDILVLMFGNEEEVAKLYPNYQSVSKEILLFDYIKDEYYILHYVIKVILGKYLL